MADQTPDEVTVGQTAAVAKLYSLAVLDEVRSAAGKFLGELDDIKRRYEQELSTGPGQFANLLAMAEQVRRDAGSQSIEHSAEITLTEDPHGPGGAE